jgi:hypothetical protein
MLARKRSADCRWLCRLLTLLLNGVAIGLPAGLLTAPFSFGPSLASRQADSAFAIRLAAATCDVGEAVVKFRDGVSEAEAAAVHTQVGAEVLRTVEGTRIQWVRARGRCDEDLVQSYESRPEVDWAQRAPNRVP